MALFAPSVYLHTVASESGSGNRSEASIGEATESLITVSCILTIASRCERTHVTSISAASMVSGSLVSSP